MQKNRLQVKKPLLTGGSHPTYFLRPSNGPSSPGIRCPEPLCKRVTDQTSPGAPCYFIHVTAWVDIPNVLHVGLSCCECDTTEGSDTLFMDAHAYLEITGSSQACAWIPKY
eukprot:5314790-Pyramimonas_sp.AAC.1